MCTSHQQPVVHTEIYFSRQLQLRYWGRLFRTTGFALSPGVLYLFVSLPFIGDVIYFVAPLWTLLCMIVAVRPGTDYKSTIRALMVIMLALIPMYVLIKIIGIVIYPQFVHWA